MFDKFCLTISAAFLVAGCATTQSDAPLPSPASLEQARVAASDSAGWVSSCGDWDEWDKPAPPFRIHGDTYYVGTCGISALLVAGEEGHVLFDTGTEAGAAVVLENVRALGFDPRNIEFVAFSHEHFDHIGGLDFLEDITGAEVITSEQAADTVRTGILHPDDPQSGTHDQMATFGNTFESLVDAGDPLTLVGSEFTPVWTPGHSPGALSWTWESCENGACVTIVYADSLSAVSADGYRFSDHLEYVQAFRESIDRLAQLDCDILLTPHPSGSGMRDKLVAGDLTSGTNCAAYAADRLERLEARLAQETGQ